MNKTQKRYIKAAKESMAIILESANKMYEITGNYGSAGKIFQTQFIDAIVKVIDESTDPDEFISILDMLPVLFDNAVLYGLSTETFGKTFDDKREAITDKIKESSRAHIIGILEGIKINDTEVNTEESRKSYNLFNGMTTGDQVDKNLSLAYSALPDGEDLIHKIVEVIKSEIEKANVTEDDDIKTRTEKFAKIFETMGSTMFQYLELKLKKQEGISVFELVWAEAGDNFSMYESGFKNIVRSGKFKEFKEIIVENVESIAELDLPGSSEQLLVGSEITLLQIMEEMSAELGISIDELKEAVRNDEDFEDVFNKVMSRLSNNEDEDAEDEYEN